MNIPSLFVIHFETRMHYASLFLLKEMIEKNAIFSLYPHDDEHVLEPILKHLHECSYVRINRHHEFVVTKKGENHIQSFLSRYSAFMEEYDVFSGVDLKEQDFAIRYYSSFQEEPEWKAFLEEERWVDLRIAIAEYQGLDAMEMTLMRFIYENRFGRLYETWNYECLLGSIWDEIQSACNNAIRLKTLNAYTREQDSELFLQTLLDKGRQLMNDLVSNTL